MKVIVYIYVYGMLKRAVVDLIKILQEEAPYFLNKNTVAWVFRVCTQVRSQHGIITLMKCHMQVKI